MDEAKTQLQTVEQVKEQTHSRASTVSRVYLMSVCLQELSAQKQQQEQRTEELKELDRKVEFQVQVQRTNTHIMYSTQAEAGPTPFLCQC